MKRFLIALMLCVAFAGTAAAQQPAANAPASKADVERLLQVMHMQQTMVKMAKAMSGPMHKMIHEEYLKDKEKCKLPADFEARMNEILDQSMQSVPWQKMIQEIVPVYQRHFTKADIDGLIAFYSGPTGQKFMREAPAISAETMQVTMPIMLARNTELIKRVKQEFQKFKKNSNQKSCVNGDAGKQ